MALPSEPEPRTWPAAVFITVLVVVLLGTLAGLLIGGWSALNDHMNDRINLRPTPTASSSR